MEAAMLIYRGENADGELIAATVVRQVNLTGGNNRLYHAPVAEGASSPVM